MNLIEQLGGYEKAKAFLNAASYTMDELIMMQRSGVRPQHVEKALLDYRRQHNIFEAMDKIVLDCDDKTIYEIDFFSSIGNGFVMKCGRAVSYSLVLRHATDEEIKAGKRLEVNQ